MSIHMDHAYALLVGVGKTRYPDWSLPVTVQDMEALRAVLIDPELCAYPPDSDHVRLLHDEEATVGAIRDGLTWLKNRATADPQATVLIYYSGHGWLDQESGRYALIPHDVKPFDVAGSGLGAEELTGALRAIPAQRLLVFVDSCHAAGMAAGMAAPKSRPPLELPPNLRPSAPPKGLVDALAQGAGRTVFCSSRGEQFSWVRPEGDLSLYTYHLLEALQGVGSKPGDTVVRVSHLMTHLGQAVPASAQALFDQPQTPVFKFETEDFPVAMLRGGRGLPAGGKAEAIEAARERIGDLTQATLIGSGAIGQQGSTVVGERGVMAGDVGGSIVTGDHSQVKESR